MHAQCYRKLGFSKWWYHLAFPPACLSPCQCLALSILLTLAILVHTAQWYLAVVCVSLITNDVEYFFKCSMTICLSSVVICLNLLSFFLIGLSVFVILSYRNLYMSWTESFIGYMYFKHVLPVCLLTLLDSTE